MMYFLVGIFSLILPTIFCDCNLEPPLCTTETCELLANEIFWQMNLTVNAEADPKAFYCNHGGQSTGHYSPRWRYFMKRALTEKQEGPKILESAQKLYKSCTDIEQRDRLGFKTVLKFIDEIGGFPMIDKNWNENSFDVNRAIALLHAKHDADSFMKIDVFMTSISIRGAADNWLSRNEDVLTKAVHMLSKDNSKDIQENLRNVFDFGAALRKAYSDSPYDPLYSTIGNFTSKPLTFINWNKVFKLISTMTGVPLNNATEISTMTPQYFTEELPKVLEKTSKRVIANYFGLRLIYNYHTYLTTDLLRIVIMSMGPLRSYIDSECLETIYVTLDPIPEILFTHKYVSPQTVKGLKTTFDLVKVAVEEFTTELNFMDRETRPRAGKKVQRMKLVIGADDDFPSEEALNARISIKYRGIGNISGNDLLEDMAIVKSAKVKNQLLQLFTEEAKYSARLNGFHRLSNTLVLRSFSVQNPSYIAGAPFVYNLGTIGNYMASQILMQISNAGAIYYENGEYKRLLTGQSLVNYLKFEKGHKYKGFRNITAEFFPVLYKQYLNFVKNHNVTNTRLPGPLKSYGLSANYVMSFAHDKCLSPWMLDEDSEILLKIYSKEMIQKC